MSPRLKSLIQYVIILGVTILLIYLSLRGLKVAEGENKWDYLQRTWGNANKGWLIAMAVLSLVSHVIRAERWRMLLEPVGYHAKLSHSFHSLMVGYLINLVIPRGGEISRCYNLYKLDKIPVIESFGTVVVERVVDLFFLVLLIAISFAFESKKLFAFIETLPLTTSGNSKIGLIIIILVGISASVTLLLWLLKKNKKVHTLIQKTWSSFKEGILSIFRLKNKGLFVLYSCIVWSLYFAMSYTVLKAFPATERLDFSAVLSLFAIGAIAMAAPLPGGTGSYHVLVPQGLFFLYQIPLSDAVAFTFIFHGWQTALFIFFGVLSLIITSFIVKRRQTAIQNHQN
ncbi:lysylphosphatidylglycerol synthase transmembrane domain-containing protein [Chryseolinea sp. H1M3-3]|uniref:lysylphosphatidylglycerol synthase transmembrane domain-containing protein n=1 Tax=Chryseolinea sp. H1M3-3 TaxID=3034144 RepID=UPI0023EB4213|nr:lysylphosphatidylglycerol synthase transmembrane domain-containing protein [Chryseolinea sp. H1M3-3]